MVSVNIREKIKMTEDNTEQEKDYCKSCDCILTSYEDGFYCKSCSDLRYPFKEGDTYYTVENGLLVCSCWDDTSKDLYDADPEKVYYCVNKSGLIEWVPQSGGNKKLCSFPPELYLRRA